jgi:hypothetical protein
VWNNNASNDSLVTTEANQFLIGATGGVGIGTASPSSQLTVHGNLELDSTGAVLIFPDGSSQTSAAGPSSSWGLVGNGGTTPGTHFLGTTDSAAIEIKVNNVRALRIEPVYHSSTGRTSNVILGDSANSVASGVFGATVSGGGSEFVNHVGANHGTVGGGTGNTVTGLGGSVVGGISNTATGDESFVGGGSLNVAEGNYAVVAGGRSNTAGGDYDSTVGGGNGNTATGDGSTVGGGSYNDAEGNHAVVGGGNDNSATHSKSFVGGGESNTASNMAATVCGGFVNSATGGSSTVAGGAHNSATATWATVPGGRWNEARGQFSFAAGRRAKAFHSGSFVWHDATYSTSDSLVSTAGNQFLARASGGFQFLTAAAPNLTTGAGLAAGSGTWGSLSSKSSKTAFENINTRDYLDRVASLELKEWKYKTEDPSVTHVGPMAEDFYATFGHGPSEESITTVDADGVALAAIQGLYELVKEQQADIERMRTAMAKAGIE